MDKFRVTKDQKIYLGDKEITCCTGFNISAKAGDDPEVELRVIVDSVDIESYRAVPEQKEAFVPSDSETQFKGNSTKEDQGKIHVADCHRSTSEDRERLAGTIRDILVPKYQEHSLRQPLDPTSPEPKQGGECLQK